MTAKPKPKPKPRAKPKTAQDIASEIGLIDIEAAMVYQVKTLVDGGIRITFDLPETAVRQAAMLMERQRDKAIVRVCIVEAA